MTFKDKTVHDIIEKLKEQYNLVTSNQFFNYYLGEASITKNDWIDIEDLINSNKYFEAEGYDLEKIYEQTLTFSRFLVTLKKEVLPKIANEADSRMAKLSIDNKVLYKMTIDNAPGNLKNFYSIIIELFITVKKIDKKLNGEDNMIYSKMNYLKEIDKNLNE